MQKVLIAIFTLAVAACATPYGEMGMFGGVAAHQIGETRFRVEARGNEMTDNSTINDYVLLKAAETAIEHGYTHFVVLGAQDTTRSGSFVTPTTTNAQVSTYGNTAFGSATTYGGNTINYRMPGAEIVVELTNDPNIATHDAQEIVTYIGGRVYED